MSRPRLPGIYLDATVRNITPLCSVRSRLGLGFDMPGQAPIRLAITVEHAAQLLTALQDYMKLAAGSQSPMSPLISSESRSVPSEGE